MKKAVAGNICRRAAAARGLTLILVLASIAAGGDQLPSGEVTFGQSVVEPAYNDNDGTLTYLLTPEKASEKANAAHTVAPLYIVMYPSAVAGKVGTMNCQHQPMDNCPDHGPAVSGLAEATVPSVYGGGVWGHDHLVAAPPSAGDFHPNWQPVVVLFTNMGAASTHITTMAQLTAAMIANDVMFVPLPTTFHGSPVGAATYRNGTPVAPAPPLP
jgi:hypothetical protein